MTSEFAIGQHPDSLHYGVPAGYADGNEPLPQWAGEARSREYYVGTSRYVQSYADVVRAVVLVALVWLVALVLVSFLPESDGSGLASMRPDPSAQSLVG